MKTKEPPFAHYKIINGKRYLRNNDWPDRFVEVKLHKGIYKGKEYWQVVPVNINHITKPLKSLKLWTAEKNHC